MSDNAPPWCKKLCQMQILKTLKFVVKFSNIHAFYICVCEIGYVKNMKTAYLLDFILLFESKATYLSQHIQ